MNKILQHLRLAPPSDARKRIPTRALSNNFGAARLFLAMMVILAHSPELLDGDRSREPLSQFFPGITFGSLAVDGFFLVSGYLITKSFLSSYSSSNFMLKRVLRIVPGYAAAFLVSLLIVGPLGGGKLFEDPALWLTNLQHLVLLQAPSLPTAFAGSHYPVLNGSMWSIAYEFRCYIAVLIVGILGGFAHRNIILAGTLLLVVASAAIGENVAIWPRTLDAILGESAQSLRLSSIYACGVCFFLFRDRITFTAVRCAAAAGAFVVLALTPHLEAVAVETAAAYLLFAFVFAIRNRRLASIGSQVDLSYGIYLYAFPIQKLTIHWLPDISPTALTLVTIVLSAACAFISFKFIETPAINLRRHFRSTNGVSPSIRGGVNPEASGNG